MTVEEQVEQVLLTLAQDLFEMEVCAGDVGKDRENAVPEYLYVSMPKRADARAKINQHFVRLAELAKQMPDAVPISILEYVRPVLANPDPSMLSRIHTCKQRISWRPPWPKISTHWAD
jgi:mediator of RNA polymerase II transcription subunit 10